MEDSKSNRREVTHKWEDNFKLHSERLQAGIQN